MPSMEINQQTLMDHFFAASSVGVVLIRSDGRLIVGNEAWSRMCGYRREELIKLNLQELIHPEDRFDEIQHILDNPLKSEIRFIQKNSGILWSSIKITMVSGEWTDNLPFYLLHVTDLTEKKEMERKLYRIEQQYRLISEYSRDIFYNSSAEGVILDCSPSVFEVLGYSPDDWLGMQEDSFYHPEDIGKLKDARADHESDLQLRLKHNNGTFLWFEIKVKILVDEYGNDLYLMVGREISERKKNEDIISEAYRIALIGSWEWDLLKDEVTFSDQIYSQIAINGNPRRIAEIVPPEDREKFEEEIEKTLEGDELSFVFRTHDEDGTVKYLHIRGVAFYSMDGKPIRINGTMQDITDRKQVELKLQETIERYTSLKKYNHDAVFSLNLEGEIINSNAMAEQLTGFQIKDMLGKSFSRLTGNTNIKEILAASLKDTSVEKRIDKIIHRNGSRSEVLATIAPIIINNENVGYYIIAKDITVQKRLMIDKETAESMNKAKGEFLAMMSHEIRTPMNGVIGMTDLLMETTSLSGEQKDYLEIIRKSGETLLTIINDILDFSKIDSGKTNLVEEPLDIRACIFESVDVLSQKAQEKDLEITFSLCQDVPSLLYGDGKRLKQVLINLIGNAIKFTATGGVFISVKKLARSDKTVNLLFKVKDTGVGIPKEKTSQLFQPFSQLNNFMTRETEGTGLGLAISKKLVNLMGGEIWLEHTNEPGATFMFTILLKDHGNQTVELKPQPSVEVKTSAALRQLNILVAEDNRINQLVLVKMLEKQGHKIRIVENGNEAIEAALTESFDLIFMDVHMPILNGLEAAATIKDTLPPDECPIIIAVTANALKGDREKCLEAGMDDYMSKPISNKVVRDTIQKFMQTHQ